MTKDTDSDAGAQRPSDAAPDLRRLRAALDDMLSARDEHLSCLKLLIDLGHGEVGQIYARQDKLPGHIAKHLHGIPSLGERVKNRFFLTRAEAGAAVAITDIEPVDAPPLAHTIEGWVTWVNQNEIATPETLQTRWADMLDAAERGYLEIDGSDLRLTTKGRNFARSNAAHLDRIPPNILENVRVEADAIADGRRSVEDVEQRLSAATGLVIDINGGAEVTAPEKAPVPSLPEGLAWTPHWTRARKALTGLKAPLDLWQSVAVSFLDQILINEDASDHMRELILECHPTVIDFAGASRSHGCIPIATARDNAQRYKAELGQLAKGFSASDLGLPITL